MSSIPKKILIDTNIIIHLEDNKEIGADYSDLSRLCAEYGIQIYIHESSYKDIIQDKDQQRRNISLSKLEKYPRIHKTPRTTQQKEAQFGAIKKPNDEVDTDLLVSLGFGAVDLLVSEDKALRARVENTDLSNRVQNVTDALVGLKNILGAVLVGYKNVQDKFCNQYPHDQPFFDSLKQDYPEFQSWYEKSCMAKQRPCWVIEQNGIIAGLIIYKDENHSSPDEKKELEAMGIPGARILKICLFKVDANVRGEKIGEQLLKKAMDYAFRNKYDATYLTVFSKHTSLVDLIKTFGFQKSGVKGEEEVYFKYTKVSNLGNSLNAFDFHKAFWPCVRMRNVEKYCIPIVPEFHMRLFPEAAEKFEKQLTFSLGDPLPQTPGNAIRKVYICNAQTTTMEPGSILLFYRSKDSAITSVGVLENYSSADSFKDLKDLVDRRSVYRDDELQKLTSKKTSAKVLNFYYAENFLRAIHLRFLTSNGVLKDCPQSITKISNSNFDVFYNKLLDPEDKEIFYD